MRDISSETLGRLARFFGNLEDSKKLLLGEQATLCGDLALGIKLTVMVTQKQLLMMLLRRDSTTHEIRHLAGKIMLGEGGKHNWEHRILKERIQLKTNEIRDTRVLWRRASARIEALFSTE